MIRPATLLTLAALAMSGAGLSACGKQAELERPAPLWNAQKKAAYEAERRPPAPTAHRRPWTRRRATARPAPRRWAAPTTRSAAPPAPASQARRGTDPSRLPARSSSFDKLRVRISIETPLPQSSS